MTGESHMSLLSLFSLNKNALISVSSKIALILSLYDSEPEKIAIEAKKFFISISNLENIISILKSNNNNITQNISDAYDYYQVILNQSLDDHSNLCALSTAIIFNNIASINQHRVVEIALQKNFVILSENQIRCSTVLIEFLKLSPKYEKILDFFYHLNIITFYHTAFINEYLSLQDSEALRLLEASKPALDDLYNLGLIPSTVSLHTILSNNNKNYNDANHVKQHQYMIYNQEVQQIFRLRSNPPSQIPAFKFFISCENMHQIAQEQVFSNSARPKIIIDIIESMIIATPRKFFIDILELHLKIANNDFYKYLKKKIISRIRKMPIAAKNQLLIQCSKYQAENIAMICVENGADVNISIDSSNLKPIHIFAASNFQTMILISLIKAGASYLEKCDDEFDAVDLLINTRNNIVLLEIEKRINNTEIFFHNIILSKLPIIIEHNPNLLRYFFKNLNKGEYINYVTLIIRSYPLELLMNNSDFIIIYQNAVSYSIDVSNLGRDNLFFDLIQVSASKYNILYIVSQYSLTLTNNLTDHLLKLYAKYSEIVTNIVLYKEQEITLLDKLFLKYPDTLDTYLTKIPDSLKYQLLKSNLTFSYLNTLKKNNNYNFIEYLINFLDSESFINFVSTFDGNIKTIIINNETKANFIKHLSHCINNAVSHYNVSKILICNVLTVIDILICSIKQHNIADISSAIVAIASIWNNLNDAGMILSRDNDKLIEENKDKFNEFAEILLNYHQDNYNVITAIFSITILLNYPLTLRNFRIICSNMKNFDEHNIKQLLVIISVPDRFKENYLFRLATSGQKDNLQMLLVKLLDLRHFKNTVRSLIFEPMQMDNSRNYIFQWTASFHLNKTTKNLIQLFHLTHSNIENLHNIETLKWFIHTGNHKIFQLIYKEWLEYRPQIQYPINLNQWITLFYFTYMIKQKEIYNTLISIMCHSEYRNKNIEQDISFPLKPELYRKELINILLYCISSYEKQQIIQAKKYQLYESLTREIDIFCQITIDPLYSEDYHKLMRAIKLSILECNEAQAIKRGMYEIIDFLLSQEQIKEHFASLYANNMISLNNNFPPQILEILRRHRIGMMNDNESRSADNSTLTYTNSSASQHDTSSDINRDQIELVESEANTSNTSQEKIDLNNSQDNQEESEQARLTRLAELEILHRQEYQNMRSQ